MNKVIIINGMGGAGKSTFVSLCHAINPSVIETSTVDFVKEVAKFAGWDGKKDEPSRKFLSELKAIMEKFNDSPNKKMDNFIKEHPNNIIFINVREPKNIQRYVNKYKAITVLVRNSNIGAITSNSSDANVENYNYDYYIYNNGDIDDLKDYALIFMEILKLKYNLS